MVVLEWLVAFSSRNCTILGLVSLPWCEEISNFVIYERIKLSKKWSELFVSYFKL